MRPSELTPNFEYIRYLDGYEKMMYPSIMILRGEFELSSEIPNVEEYLNKKLPTLFNEFDITRLSVCTLKGKPCFVKSTLPPLIKTVSFDLLGDYSCNRKVLTVKSPIELLKEWKSGMPLPMVFVSTSNSVIRLHLCCSHCLSDGRTIEGIYRIVAHLLDKKIPLPINSKLTDFGQQNLFPKLTKSEATTILPSILDLPKSPRINPPEENIVFSDVSDYLQYSYAEISAFCKMHKVGVQAIMMCAFQRGLRKYFNVKNDVPLIGNVPADSRTNSCASEEMKQRELFSGSACVFPIITSKDDFIEEIVACNTAMKEIQKSIGSAALVTYLGTRVNADNGEDYPYGFDLSTDMPFVGVSNIGCYKYVTRPRVCCVSESKRLLPSIIYGYKEESILNVYWKRSAPMPQNFLDTIIEQFDDIFTKIGSKRV
ncbi:hypothetical protein EIN_436430 [Entamoeba invadens IP1]|uniref:Condensation domain-containing protein n=1 Tax=Entamoeba invadens IP1 TaxID=370355 RepID=A0A0A1U3H8_ENTIV|nr:hypothetical protein EIN_436430 [Entamoeba invadens IP1]ELP88773.1 hypothetical protein EIN_436430 [Entamoeba invadens IP1]|eukprot:XP_004255544.1 hypothetical protein EIN_436430 [Entamoeba invadens IP1]